ncbi:MAG TPA: AsnC family transcriptional regulator, partial [Candidatus Thalassarchaeaceae archaeon]
MPLSGLDLKDRRIIELLSGDARMSTQSIADQLNMPRVTAHD